MLKNAKEVGFKKVIGALRRSLMYQFLLESFLLTAISMTIAIATYRAAVANPVNALKYE